MNRPRIFVFADYFLPGFKAGGPINSLMNLIQVIGEKFEVFVFTRDRDSGDSQPYPNTVRDEWTPVGKSHVLYTRDLTFQHVRKRIREVLPQIIYLNSLFSTLSVKTFLLRRFGLLPDCHLVLAPRGELSPGALGIKRLRKSAYRKVATFSGFFTDVVWHAASDRERTDIEKSIHANRWGRTCVIVAPDIPDISILGLNPPVKPSKTPGAVRFLFLSRIARIKNLPFALEALRGLDGRIEFDIYGPIEDSREWHHAKKLIEQLPGNILVRYRGVVPNVRVVDVAASYHFFILPTKGESFGHAIWEAMAAGCAVVLSDQTSWRDLVARNAGWTLPLGDPERWRKLLQMCVQMDQTEFETYSTAARRYAECWCRSVFKNDRCADLFRAALGGSKSDVSAVAVKRPVEATGRVQL